jgi:hypothetical protein
LALCSSISSSRRKQVEVYTSNHPQTQFSITQASSLHVVRTKVTCSEHCACTLFSRQLACSHVYRYIITCLIINNLNYCGLKDRPPRLARSSVPSARSYIAPIQGGRHRFGTLLRCHYWRQSCFDRCPCTSVLLVGTIVCPERGEEGGTRCDGGKRR